MVVWAVGMVKDEADIIGATVRNMAAQVDRIIVADNGSTDGTRDVLADLARDLALAVIDDPEPAYFQSRKMTALAYRAGQQGAEWIVPFDADEWWCSAFGRLADVLGRIGTGHMTAEAELWDHVSTGLDPDEHDPIRRICWRRPEPLPMPKVACRWRSDLEIAQGNHGASYGGIIPQPGCRLTVHHYPYRSAAQFVQKVRNGCAAYRAAGDSIPRDVGAHWRQWGDILHSRGPEAVEDIFRKWFWRADPTTHVLTEGELQPALVWDPVIR